MATYTATGDGCIEAAVSALKVMLSRCAEIQTFLGAASEAAALALIDVNADAHPADEEETADLSTVHPRVLVFANPEQGWNTSMDAIGSFVGSGTLQVVLERELTNSELTDDALMIDAVQTTLGRVQDELWQQVWTDAAVAATDIKAMGPFRGDDNTEADLGNKVTGVLEIEVGVSGGGRF